MEASKYFEVASVSQAFEAMVSTLQRNPEYISSPRGKEVKEITNACIKVCNPYDRIVSDPARKMSLRYLAGELAFYFSCSDKLSFINHYAKFWNNVCDDGVTVNSAYGKRLFDDSHKTKEWNLVDGQLFREASIESYTPFEAALNHLLNDKDSRKAVMPIYNSADASISTLDTPCTMYLQFFIRNGKLNCHAYMRSNDIWLGLPYDMAFFTSVQERMLVRLNSYGAGVDMGYYVHNAGSLHLYETNYKDVEELLNFSGNEKRVEMAKMSEFFEIDLMQFIVEEARHRLNNDFSSFSESKVRDPYLLQILSWLKGGK